MNQALSPQLSRALIPISLAFASAALAQTVPPTSTESPGTDEVLVLSPFEVTTAEDRGYQATSTLAGTRIRTDLKDVGSAITVVTKDFLSDIGATDTSTLLQYTPSSEVAGTRGTYAGLGNGQSVDETNSLRNPTIANRVRGLASADNTRDFFGTDIPWDSFNVDRIDLQRGPNSILFGLGSPAGIINATTRNAEFRNVGEVQGRFGSYDSWRVSLDYNQVLIPNVLAIRFDGLWDYENFQQEPAFEDDERYYGAIRFDPQLFKNRRDFRTSIKAKFEHGEIDANRPRIITPNDSITPWFRPLGEIDPLTGGRIWTANSGMGKTPVNNGYDANRNSDIVAGNGLGLQTRNTTNPNYQPWLSAPVNQQQPFWLVDGATGEAYRVVGGYINPGARNPDGSFRGAAQGINGRRYADQFFGLTNLSSFANNASLPLSGSGLYRTASLLDPTVFDFYNNLIDGPTKSEFEKWDAYNIDFSQTAFDDRLGLQLTYDRQKYERGGEAFLGGQPTITIDILKNFQDYYLTGASGETITNPNFGRPYATSNAGGSGNAYESDREYYRGSLFAELRAADVLENDFLVKLFGKHRFNGVYSEEQFVTEERTWNRLATSQEWDAYWNGNDGSTSSITNRPPMAFVYLGSSIADRDSASGAHLPGIGAPVPMNDANAYVFDSTWLNLPGVGFGDPWTIPASLAKIYDPAVATTQSSNPDNYVGWSDHALNLLRYDNGADNRLLTRAQKAKRLTESYAFSWQGYLWNEAIVPTVGWRHDEVKGKDVTARQVSSNRGILNLDPAVYGLPRDYPEAQIFEDESTSYGVVVHLNKLLGERDPLPIDVSVSYNKSDNFQVTSTRRNIYGSPIGNPTGKTKDYGVLLSTKDGKFSLRAVKYETSVQNANAELSNPAGIGGTIAQGLRFRNVFLYDLALYDWGSRDSPQQRNTWGGPAGSYSFPTADSSISIEEGRRREDAAITTWNEIQAYLTDKGFFEAWGFTPQPLSVLTDRTTYEANPAAFVPPDTSQVFAYVATAPQGFTVTADTESKGYEFEFTANPLPNWRIAFNASKTEATRNNVGGAELAELIEFLDSKLYNPDGTPSLAGAMPQFGNTGLSINNNNYNPWHAGYTLMKIQEGAAAPEIRKWRYNVITNYMFNRGPLKGVGLGASYRWQDKVVIGYPVVQDGARFTYDLSRPYHGPSEDAVDLWASYERKLTNKIRWKIQLNVRNAFAKEELIPISVQPDGQTFASVRIAPNQEWFVTNTFSF